MAAMDPIDISSSDSDMEIGEARQSETLHRQSSNLRILPPWGTNHSIKSGSTGYGGQSRTALSQERANASDASTSNANNHSQTKMQMLPGSREDNQGSNRHAGRAEDSNYFSGNGNVGQLQTVNSRIANISSADFEKISSQQALKRTLPAFSQPCAPSTKSKYLVENVSSSQIHDAYGNSYNLAGPGATNGEGYMRDYYLKGKDDDIMMYENNGNRVLPSSLMHGKNFSSAQFGGPSDSVYRSGLTEERAVGSDERLIYEAAVEELNQPKVEATLPDGLLSVSLLRHQRIALAWMLQKETRSLHCLGGILADDQGLGKTISIIALIQMQKFLQSKSKTTSNHKPEALNLDDDDNDGAVSEKAKQTEESDEIKPVPEASTSTRAFSRRRPAAGTLVVCPATVLRQWARELDDKVSDEAKLSVLIYHGGSRTKDPVELANYDVVLTTYSIVTNEVPKQPLVDEDEGEENNGDVYGVSSVFSINKKRKKISNVSKKGKKGTKENGSSIDCGWGTLAKVAWFRVVLDEAQTIKNHRTQVARACCSLRAKRRWCLSGTPIQNAIDDLYSYFRFLRYDPYAAYKSFYNTIKIPISRNSLHGYMKLQVVLKAIMLRRTKETKIDNEPIINLPPKSTYLKKVDFSTEEWGFYRKLESDSHKKFKAYADAGTVNQNYANILLMLLRLRQACDHPLLVKGYNFDSVGKFSVEMAKRLPRDMLIDLLSRLETSSAICCVCSDPPEDSVVTMCGHVFCYQCVSEYTTGDDNTCPAPKCKEQLGPDVVFSKVSLTSCLSDDVGAGSMDSEFTERSMILQDEFCSAKIRSVLEILLSHCKLNSSILELHGPTGSSRTFAEGVLDAEETTLYSESPTKGPIKSIVFSQWTRMLDLVEFSLNQHCIQYRRLDGTMTLPSRDRAVKDFNTDPEITVMLMSLKAGNLGLNMVAACHVILLDPWWNPTTEDQAVDRAHRIGQTRPVTVTRITIKDTVEDKIISLQEEKRKMVASAFGEDHGGGGASRLTVDDLKFLFTGVQLPR
ncbi:helicase-like transcription factor CHR28 [Pistacia vera]|uniref:helicase-like transcription factor CHR28 n=1 Tax=Pistacia vera TaxID=55513 RepID=UPI0012639BC3|nr:helicase-like transcription factor CHR28 [Pistacia vera]